jgi:hypothetical protein
MTDFEKVTKEMDDFLSNKNHKNIYLVEFISILEKHFSYGEIFSYFRDDDLLSHLEGSYELEDYVEEKIEQERMLQGLFEKKREMTKETLIDEIKTYNKNKFRDFLVDLTNNSYCVDNDTLLNDLKLKISH